MHLVDSNDSECWFIFPFLSKALICSCLKRTNVWPRSIFRNKGKTGALQHPIFLFKEIFRLSMLLCNHSALFKDFYGKPRQYCFLFINSPWCFFFFSSSLLLSREGKAQCLLTDSSKTCSSGNTLTEWQIHTCTQTTIQPETGFHKQQIMHQWWLHGSQILQQVQMFPLPLIYTDNIVTGSRILHARSEGSSHTLPLLWYIPSFVTDVSPDSM